MAPSSSSSPSSSKSPPSPSPSPLHYPPSNFTPIQECEREEDEYSEGRGQNRATPSGCTHRGVSPAHHSTPIHPRRDKNGKPHSKLRPASESMASEDVSVKCNKCRPHVREKTSVVPLDNSSGMHKHSFSMASPNWIFKSLISSLTRKSPKSINDGVGLTDREEQWKIALAELSHKLIQTTRKRDEALLEASRLKYSMAELEKKLNKLELYCHSLKSGLEECSENSQNQNDSVYQANQQLHVGGANDKVIEHFLVAVSESRSSVRLLSRALTMQLRHMGVKVYERLSSLLQPYDVKVSLSRNPRNLVLYLEALLNKAFFEDFESIGFQKNGQNQILNPLDRCEANFGSFTVLQGLTWEEVLSKGTKHFSEDFSKFCDRKMSEIVAMLGWNRAWSEPLLQAFFCASKSVWLVHLLATSVHPSLPIFRVDKEIGFDSVYMEDMGGDKAKKLFPSMVKIMVSPGFYVYGSVVKCKVVCRYYNSSSISYGNEKGMHTMNLSP